MRSAIQSELRRIELVISLFAFSMISRVPANRCLVISSAALDFCRPQCARECVQAEAVPVYFGSPEDSRPCGSAAILKSLCNGGRLRTLRAHTQWAITREHLRVALRG